MSNDNKKAYHCNYCDVAFNIEIRMVSVVNSDKPIEFACCPLCGRYKVKEMSVQFLDDYLNGVDEMIAEHEKEEKAKRDETVDVVNAEIAKPKKRGRKPKVKDQG